MTRAYQHNFSIDRPYVFEDEARRRKAKTIVRVCQDFLGTESLAHLDLLDVGSSSGIIDDSLADHFRSVIGIDIDEPAVSFAQSNFKKPNLRFSLGDAMALEQADDSVDVVVCSHVYEHVPDAGRMFDEIYRVLKPGGFCYFSGNNRVMFMEPHYRLPFLSLLPRSLAHLYVRVTGRARFYHEKHLGYRSLKQLCSHFTLIDYSRRIIIEPDKYSVDYMLKKGSFKWRIAKLMAVIFRWGTPNIWILRKEAPNIR